MLPHSARLMEPRAPEAMRAFTEAVGTDVGALAARCGHTRVSSLGVEEQQLPGIAETVASHSLLGNTPDPPGAEELLAVLRAAL
jgi:alcohol dehydrogenase class IV